MTDDLTELRVRHDRLEGRVAILETTVKEEAGLRAKMDSDLGEMKATMIAHKHSLQALHDTQSDHTKRLTRIEDKVGHIDDRVGHIEDKVGHIDDRVGHLEDRVGHIEEKLGDVHIGVHAILDLLDTHLARKPKWENLAGLLRRNR